MLTDTDTLAAGNRKPETQRQDGHGSSNARHPDWLQNFTVNLEDLEKHVPAHFLKEHTQIWKVL